MESVVAPSVLLPHTAGVAFDDPNTQLGWAARTAQLVRYVAITIVFAVLWDGLVVWAAQRHDRHLGALAVVAGLGFVLWVRLLAVAVVSRRRRFRLYSRFPWREVPAEVIRTRPGVVSVSLDGREKQFELRLGGRALSIRTHGRVWLCGPDERGRAFVRVAGFAQGWRARLRTGPPVQTTGPREPIVEGDHRSALPGKKALGFGVWPLFVLMLGTATFVAGWRHDSFVAMVTGGILLVAGLVRSVALGKIARRLSRQRRFQRWPAQDYTTFRLVSWSPGKRLRGVLIAEVDLADGSRLRLEARTAGLNLVANIEAGARVRIVGMARPGSPVALGVPGYSPYEPARVLAPAVDNPVA